VKQTQYWNIVIVGGVTIYLVISAIYLFLGQANADEGWYLYASKLVWQGQLPYQDFAYTQTPLLPYIYGLPQIILGPGIYLGRITSILFSAIMLVVYLSIAYKHSGKIGAGMTVILLSTFTYGMYFMSIVKTYALLAVLFAFVLLALESDYKHKYLIAIALSFLASMARLSAVAFAIPVVLYCLFATRNKWLAVLLCLSLASVAAFFFLPDIDATRWNLITHHVMQGNPSVSARLAEIPSRLMDFAKQFYIYIGLAMAIGLIGYSKVSITPLSVFAIGLASFSASHLITGGWHIEYFVPAMVGFLTLIAIAFAKVYTTQRVPRQLAILAILVLPASRAMPFVDISGGALPVEEIREVSEYISEYSVASDKILALEALWTVVESDRQVLDGMTMAQFSYVDMDWEGASQLKLVNGKIVLEYIQKHEARLIVLTDGDWELFEVSGYGEKIRHALSKHYTLILTRGEFGQQSNNVYVYTRK